jgi:hypothetical protein
MRLTTRTIFNFDEVPATELEPGAIVVSGVVLYTRHSGDMIWVYCPDTEFLMRKDKVVQVLGRVGPSMLEGFRRAAEDTQPNPHVYSKAVD